jgi:hypothetical protein
VFHEGILAHPVHLLRVDEPEEDKHGGDYRLDAEAASIAGSRGAIKTVAKQTAEKRNKAKKKSPSGAEAH